MLRKRIRSSYEYLLNVYLLPGNLIHDRWTRAHHSAGRPPPPRAQARGPPASLGPPHPGTVLPAMREWAETKRKIRLATSVSLPHTPGSRAPARPGDPHQRGARGGAYSALGSLGAPRRGAGAEDLGAVPVGAWAL